MVEAVVEEANATSEVARPAQASSFVQLRQVNAELWSYRTNPE